MRSGHFLPCILPKKMETEFSPKQVLQAMDVMMESDSNTICSVSDSDTADKDGHQVWSHLPQVPLSPQGTRMRRRLHYSVKLQEQGHSVSSLLCLDHPLCSCGHWDDSRTHSVCCLWIQQPGGLLQPVTYR